MKALLSTVAIVLVAIGLIVPAATAQTIEQQLVVTQNNGVNFSVAVQVKGTSLPAANTLGSATIDVTYDNTKLTYLNANGWAFSGAEGYSRSATNNGTFIRVGVTGGAVNENGGGDPPGFDIGSSYVSWVTLNFSIQSPENTSLGINPATNAIGLFENHSNEPLTGAINNQTLTPPIGIDNEPLPIQLASFTAGLVQENNVVVLKWSTASEVNNYGFEVQKSKDNQDNFKTIEGSFVEGNGTTTDPQSYTYTDIDVQPGTWYYRLKQIDLDNTVHYSEAITPSVTTGVAERPLPKEFGLDQNYPNPFNPSTVIEFALPRESRVTLEVYNLLGQRVQTLVDDVRPAGYHTVRFNATGLSSGIYFYRMRAGEDVSFLRKMLLMK
jgi:hypothetical protein